ncbi:O-antigen ligase family protein [Agromyces aerolatus]|uniref:O-antigen ligase family protein n=1 Tax=Agromyces sp. LY-1074 TaxID=3074080 RepID=UPI002855D9B1|nr:MULTISPECIES: O-antigen ligase family protein [unclassified Agromyces]MDR5701481.1 hypothetical protein [Agromyces sp. LY-1074]MDR5704452.1 hypothetical protein [Agromyces sp. LY-1358]
MAATVLLGPFVALVAVAIAAVILAIALRPQMSVYLVILIGLTAYPAFVPYQVTLGSFTIFVYEPVLFIAAVWSFVLLRGRKGIVGRTCVLLGLVAIWGAAGIAVGNPVIEVIGDARGLVNVALFAMVAASIFGTIYERTSLKVLLASLWVSAVVTLLSSLVGFPVAGRREDASLVLVDGGATASGATRLLTAATEISVLVLCVAIALAITGKVRLNRLVPYIIPATIITALGFSRNSVLAIGVAVILAFLVARTSIRSVAKIIGAVLAITLLFILGAAAGAPGAAYVSDQVTAFTGRVLNGLSSSTVASDSSALARQSENAYAGAAFAESPIVGHGLGYAYRPAVGEAGTFSATKGQYYAHNFWLWTLVKSGVLGLMAILICFLAPVLVALRTSDLIAKALAAAMIGLLVSMFFAPFVNDPGNGGSLAVGALLGATWGSIAAVRSHSRVLTDAV